MKGTVKIPELLSDQFGLYGEEWKAIVGERRFKVLSMRIEQQMTFREIAFAMGISACRACQLYHRAKNLIIEAGYAFGR